MTLIAAFAAGLGTGLTIDAAAWYDADGELPVEVTWLIWRA